MYYYATQMYVKLLWKGLMQAIDCIPHETTTASAGNKKI